MKRINCVVSSYAYVVKNINYGSLLQYYALQTFLVKLGEEAYWLRYTLEEKESIAVKLKAAAKRILHPVRSARRIRCQKSYLAFINRYLAVSGCVYETYESLVNNPPEADRYITGSDQVWGGTVKANYLCFVHEKSKKTAYAASFGTDMISREQMNAVKMWIRDIENVSVREPSGISICRLMGVDAVEMADPALLLDKEEYPVSRHAAEEENAEVFCYFLNISREEEIRWPEIKKFAKRKGKVIKAAGVPQTEKIIPDGNLVYPSPEEWLGFYDKAEYIFTNTFHGTVFAIIFRKKFLVFLQEGATKSQNGRLLSLLKKLKLEFRLYRKEESLEAQMERPIDWNTAESVIKGARERAALFLSSEGGG